MFCLCTNDACTWHSCVVAYMWKSEDNVRASVPCGSQGLDSGSQALWKVLLPAEPSQQPRMHFLNSHLYLICCLFLVTLEIIFSLSQIKLTVITE